VFRHLLRDFDCTPRPTRIIQIATAEVLFSPLSNINLRIGASTVIAGDPWNAAGGADVANMRTCAPDQRIKVFFPDAAGKAPALSADTWLADYQAMSPADRPPRRTYTIRALRPSDREVDIDFVLHGSTGPASHWRRRCCGSFSRETRIGKRVTSLAPVCRRRVAGRRGRYFLALLRFPFV